MHDKDAQAHYDLLEAKIDALIVLLTESNIFTVKKYNDTLERTLLVKYGVERFGSAEAFMAALEEWKKKDEELK